MTNPTGAPTAEHAARLTAIVARIVERYDDGGSAANGDATAAREPRAPKCAVQDDEWKVRDRAANRARIIGELGVMQMRASELGLYKLSLKIRDTLLPLACEDMADAVVSDQNTVRNSAIRLNEPRATPSPSASEAP